MGIRSVRRVAMFFAVAAGSIGATWADDFSVTEAKLKSALSMDHRSEKSRIRDENRNAVEAIRFCRLRDDMTVLEFGPGSGWYTEVLGPVLLEKGSLVIAYNVSWMEKVDGLLARHFMAVVKKQPIDISWNAEEKRFNVGNIDYGVEGVDLALNIREYHNIGANGAKRINATTHAALEPGGYYCIIDHARRHMEPTSGENRRCADPVSVVLAVQAAGFELIDSSDLFFKPDDELRYEAGRKTVTGNTDRFSLLFRKFGD